MSDGFEALHYILELPPGLARLPARRRATRSGSARNPIYALLHEACWADGGVTNWSAQRMRPATSTSSPSCFTAEHIFPWMFEDYGALAPAREVADELAATSGRGCMTAEVLRRQRGPDRGRDLHRGPLRRARVLRGDGRGDAQPARVGDQRVRPQRAARRRRAHPRPADRPCPRTRLSRGAPPRPARRARGRARDAALGAARLRVGLPAPGRRRRRPGAGARGAASSRSSPRAPARSRTRPRPTRPSSASARRRPRCSAIPAPAGPPPTDDLKTLFRDAAKRMHPDLVPRRRPAASTPRRS